MNQHARDNAVWAGIAALLMLGYGWTSGLEGTADSAFYNATVDIFVWTLRIGGIALAVVAILCALGQRVGLLLDVFASGVSGAVMAACGVYWILSDGFFMQFLMYAIFGFMFLNAARSCWVSYRATGGPRRPAPLVPSIVPRAPEPIHPASLHPDSLPKDGEPPPPDGYLAALAKEKDEPPRASFE